MGFSSERFELTELFMAKAGNDFSTCFYGTIMRLRTEDGSSYCFGKITVNNGFVCARESNQELLGRNLDEIVLLVLDYGLHYDCGKLSSITGTTIFLN